MLPPCDIFPKSSQSEKESSVTIHSTVNMEFLLKNIFPNVNLSVVFDFFATPRAVACQVPLSIEFSRQEYWSGLPFPSPGDLSDPGIKAGTPALQANSLPSEPAGKPILPKETLT